MIGRAQVASAHERAGPPSWSCWKYLVFFTLGLWDSKLAMKIFPLSSSKLLLARNYAVRAKYFFPSVIIIGLQYHLLIVGCGDSINPCHECDHRNDGEPTNGHQNIYTSLTLAKQNLIILLCEGQKANAYKKMYKLWGFWHGAIIKIWINFGHFRSLHPKRVHVIWLNIF